MTRNRSQSAQHADQLDPAGTAGGLACQADQEEGRSEEQNLGGQAQSGKTLSVTVQRTADEVTAEDEATAQLQSHGQRAGTRPSSSECIMEAVPNQNWSLSANWKPPTCSPIPQSSPMLTDETGQISSAEEHSWSPWTMSQDFITARSDLEMPAAECKFPANTEQAQARQRMPGSKGQSECTGISYRHVQKYVFAS